MTAQAGYYGSDAVKNRFLAIPSGKGKNEKYFMQVKQDEPNKGRMQVWNEEFGQDRMVGFLDPDTNVFTPDRTFTKGARQFEEDFFTTPEGKKLIRQQAKNTVVKSKIEDGENITEAQKEANKLAKNNEKQDNATKDFISGEAKKATQAKVGTRKDFGTFAYPLTLRKTDQDVIKFTILEYKPRGFKAKEGSLDFFDERNVVKDRRIAGNIVLPIPGVVTDANACEWGEDSMTALDAALANIGLEFLTGDVSGALKNTGSAIQKNKEDIKTALSTAVVSAATGSKGQSLLTRATGNIMNPNMELLFKKPALRPFNFTFKLAPRSREEGEEVIQIIRSFKQAMAPIKSASYLFLKSPYTFRLQYLHRGSPHPALNLFKECALQTLTVNYAPEGQYATYEDGVPTAYEMQMQFQELEPVFNDDYDNNDSFSSASGSSSVPSVIGY
jgi:hypothetical protein